MAFWGTPFDWRRHFDGEVIFGGGDVLSGEDIFSDGVFLIGGDILMAKSFWVVDKF